MKTIQQIEVEFDEQFKHSQFVDYSAIKEYFRTSLSDALNSVVPEEDFGWVTKGDKSKDLKGDSAQEYGFDVARQEMKDNITKFLE